MALMRSLQVVVLHPRIEIGLQLLQCPIDLLPGRDPIELIQHGRMEPFAVPVGLGMPGLRARVIYIFHGQVQFILMPLGCAAVFGPTVGQDAEQRNRMRLKERQHPIMHELGRRDWRLLVRHLGKPDLTVRVDERLMIDGPGFREGEDST
jgi:hypothetical protein